MSADDILRLRYYERQFLHARDFVDEQGYFIESRRRHQIGEHTWGIVSGLKVRKNASDIWVITAGFAVDAYGREIYLFEDEPLDTAAIAAQLGAKTAALKLWIAYSIEQTSPAIGNACTNESRNTRTRESFELIYQDDPRPFDGPAPAPPVAWQDLPDDPDSAPWPVFLGNIQWDKTEIKSVDEPGRTYAGLRGVEVFSETAQFDIHAPLVRIDRGADPAATATLSTVGATKLHLNTDSGAGGSEVFVDKDDLHVTKNAIVDGKITVTGTAGDGTGKLHIEADAASDLAVVTRPANGAGSAHNLALRTNDDGGGNSIVIDKDDLECAQGLFVDGSVTLKGGLSVQGGQIVFLEPAGGDNTDAITLSRVHRATDKSDFRVQIGDNNVGDDRFVVGPQGQDSFVVDNAGNVITTGLVNGRDMAADAIKLSSISFGAKQTAVVQGFVFDGNSIPLPAGFAAAQCQAIVSPWSPSSNFTHPILGFDCLIANTNTFAVTMKWRVATSFFLSTFTLVPGWASYLIIGVK